METLEDCLDRQGVWSREYGAAMMGSVVASIAHDGSTIGLWQSSCWLLNTTDLLQGSDWVANAMDLLWGSKLAVKKGWVLLHPSSLPDCYNSEQVALV